MHSSRALVRVLGLKIWVQNPTAANKRKGEKDRKPFFSVDEIENVSKQDRDYNHRCGAELVGIQILAHSLLHKHKQPYLSVSTKLVA